MNDVSLKGRKLYKFDLGIYTKTFHVYKVESTNKNTNIMITNINANPISQSRMFGRSSLEEDYLNEDICYCELCDFTYRRRTWFPVLMVLGVFCPIIWLGIMGAILRYLLYCKTKPKKYNFFIKLQNQEVGCNDDTPDISGYKIYHNETRRKCIMLMVYLFFSFLVYTYFTFIIVYLIVNKKDGVLRIH